jgi:hypothetical protein
MIIIIVDVYGIKWPLNRYVAMRGNIHFEFIFSPRPPSIRNTRTAYLIYKITRWHLKNGKQTICFAWTTVLLLLCCTTLYHISILINTIVYSYMVTLSCYGPLIMECNTKAMLSVGSDRWGEANCKLKWRQSGLVVSLDLLCCKLSLMASTV